MGGFAKNGTSLNWAPDESSGRTVKGDIASGQKVSDALYDGLLSPRARGLAGRHWTPIEAAKRAAFLLTQGKECRVLDVGSGAGKFCIVGALTTPAHFHGVEQRPWLVAESTALSRMLGIPRVTFQIAQMRDLDWGSFDAFYFFNPFYENIEETARIDAEVLVSETRFNEHIAVVLERLSQAKVGTRVVTYHGLGADLPASYKQVVREVSGSDYLELFVKRPALNVAPFPGDNFDFQGPCTD